MNKSCLLIVGVLILLALFTASAYCSIPQHYTVTPIDYGCNVMDINSSGQVVGFASNPISFTGWKSFIWTNGNIQYLPCVDGSTFSVAYAINDAGVVVGMSGSCMATWNNGLLDLGNSTYGEYKDINDNGDLALHSGGGVKAIINGTTYSLSDGIDWKTITQVHINNNDELIATGSSESLFPTEGYSAYYWSSDLVRTQLPFERASAINDLGQVVGFDSGGQTGYLWQDGNVEALDLLPSAINNNGLICGYTTVSGQPHASICEDGVVTDLNTLASRSGVTFAYGTAINDLGQIVVTNKEGSSHYLLTPDVPEPSSIIVLLSGIGGLCVLLRKLS